MRDVKTVHLLI